MSEGSAPESSTEISSMGPRVDPGAPELNGSTEAAIERRAQAHPLDLPRLIGGVLGDIRAIAEGMAVLPRLLSTLQGIEQRVETLNEEVSKMRAGVDGMGGDVGGLRDSFERIEPHLEDVSRAAKPLQRLGSRAKRGREPGR